MLTEDGYIQIGLTVLRDPITKEPTSSVPLYIRADDQTLAAENKLYEDFAKMLAFEFKKYKEKCGEQGLTP